MSEALIQVHELWYDDGSIILRAHRYIFKVYKGILASRSPVLAALFHEKEKKRNKKSNASAAEAGGPPEIDGCPIVKLDDDPEDLRVFLLAIHHTGFFPESKPTDFDTLSGILRLSIKYSLADLLQRCINHLLSTYPQSLEDWDRRSKTRTLPSVSNAPFVVLELIRELEEAIEEKGWGRRPEQVIEDTRQFQVAEHHDEHDETDAESTVSTTMDITVPSTAVSSPRSTRTPIVPGMTTTTTQTPQTQPFHNALVALGLHPSHSPQQPQSPRHHQPQSQPQPHSHSQSRKPTHTYPNPITPLSIVLPAVLYCCCTHSITDFFDGVFWSGTSPLSFLPVSPYTSPLSGNPISALSKLSISKSTSRSKSKSKSHSKSISYDPFSLPDSRLAVTRPLSLGGGGGEGAGSRLPPVPSTGFREEVKESQEREKEREREALRKARVRAKAKAKEEKLFLKEREKADAKDREKEERRARKHRAIEQGSSTAHARTAPEHDDKENVSLIDWDGEEEQQQQNVSGSLPTSLDDDDKAQYIETQPVPPDSLLLTPTPTHSEGGDDGGGVEDKENASVMQTSQAGGGETKTPRRHPLLAPRRSQSESAGAGGPGPTVDHTSNSPADPASSALQTSNPSKGRVFGPRKPGHEPSGTRTKSVTKADANANPNAQDFGSTFDHDDDVGTIATTKRDAPIPTRRSSSNPHRDAYAHAHGYDTLRHPQSHNKPVTHGSKSTLISTPPSNPHSHSRAPSNSTSHSHTTPLHLRHPKPYPPPPRRIKLSYEDQRRCMIAVTELIDRKSELIYGFLRRERVDGCLFDVDVVSESDSESEPEIDEEDGEGEGGDDGADGGKRRKGKEKEKEKHKKKHKGKGKGKEKEKERGLAHTPCTYARLHAFATRTVLDVAVLQDDFDWRDFEKKVCSVCYEKAKKEFMKERKRVWEELPGVFGLPSWSVLCSALDFAEREVD